MFNMKDASNEELDQSHLDCIVDKRRSTSEFGVLVIQYTKVSEDEHLLIGVLHIEMESNNRYFSIDQAGTGIFHNNIVK